MSAQLQSTKTPPDPVDEVLVAHDGDARAAIASLLEDVEYFRAQAAYGSLVTSRGYTYGWMSSYKRLQSEED